MVGLVSGKKNVLTLVCTDGPPQALNSHCLPAKIKSIEED